MSCASNNSLSLSFGYFISGYQIYKVLIAFNSILQLPFIIRIQTIFRLIIDNNGNCSKVPQHKSICLYKQIYNLNKISGRENNKSHLKILMKLLELLLPQPEKTKSKENRDRQRENPIQTN